MKSIEEVEKHLIILDATIRACVDLYQENSSLCKHSEYAMAILLWILEFGTDKEQVNQKIDELEQKYFNLYDITYKDTVSGLSQYT